MITPDFLSNLPTTFGIYQYLDPQGKILYIGKAKNLKKRIKSYFSLQDGVLIPSSKTSQRIQIMLSQASDIRTIIVSSEQDALLLENSLIKQLKPKYNILLRDDKTYPYICIDLGADFPRFEMTRKLTPDKSAKLDSTQSTKGQNLRYFGPYPSGCKDILDSLYNLLPLVQKKSCLRAKKACLFHQIGKCPAPCEGKITKEAYHTTITQALTLLQNKSKLLESLTTKMQDLAQKLLFEEANLYKTRIAKITPLTNFSSIAYHKPHDFDILSIAQERRGGHYESVLLKLFMRGGRIIASDFETLKNDFEIDKPAIYRQFILNHYKDKLPLAPEAILLDCALDSPQAPDTTDELESFIALHQDKKIPIQTPQKGLKATLIKTALTNAQEILRQQNSQSTTLTELKTLLNLSQTPFRIEIFDTSHHSFSFNVGAMVVYENDAFLKDAYRHYNLTTLDEYSQMQELLTRRIQSFEKSPPPNLWLIDGGRAQLNLAKKLLESAGIELDVIALAKEKLDHKAHRAKGSAKDTIYTLESTLALKPQDTRLQLLQKLRDEAHRYAISFHRRQKTKGLFKAKTPYTPAQLKKLLDFYGDFETLQNAPTHEITKILKK